MYYIFIFVVELVGVLLVEAVLVVELVGAVLFPAFTTIYLRGRMDNSKASHLAMVLLHYT